MNSPKRLLDRKQVQSQFDRAAATYDDVSSLQRRMGSEVLQRIVNHGIAKDSHLIDLGCGTGELLQQLELAGYSNLCGLDLSSQMISVAQQKAPSVNFHHAAIEEIPFDDGSFEVVVSNAAIQWCDIQSAATEISRVLKNEGTLFANVFSKGTLRQWHDAFLVSGYESRVHPLATANEIETAFEKACFGNMEVHTQTETTTFDSVKSMLDSIRRLGATNAMSSRARSVSRTEYLTLKDHFQRLLDSNDKLELDFEWVQISARKMAQQ